MVVDLQCSSRAAKLTASHCMGSGRFRVIGVAQELRVSHRDSRACAFWVPRRQVDIERKILQVVGNALILGS